MCRLFAHALLLHYFICLYALYALALIPNTPETISIDPNSQIELHLNNVSESTSYVIFQAHTQYKNITLSLYPTITTETSETGSSVGVLIVVKGQSDLSVVLTSQQNVTLKVLMFVSELENALSPVPGGCNLEFNMKNDPNFHLGFHDDITDVKFQWASKSTNDYSCEKSPVSTKMSYHLYVYYMGDSDWSEDVMFQSVKKMITAEDVQKNGKKVNEIKYSASKLPLMKLPSYTGQGTIYNIIVEHNNKMAAYVPIVTYSCDMDDRDSKCNYTSTVVKVLMIIPAIAGIFLCFAGHRYFQTGQFLMSFCGFCIVFYLILSITSNQSVLVIFVLSCILATVAAVLWLMAWWFLGQAVLSVLVPALTAGYIFACVLFYTPFGNLHYWTARYNYGMTFCIAVLILPVFILYWTKVLNILSCAFVGSFLGISAVDVWIDGGIKYIIINTFRHAYVSEYLDVVVTGPFQVKDIILSCVWIVLFISGAVFQFHSEKGKPEFPPCPRKSRQMRQIGNNGPNPKNRDRQTEADADERTPLIRPVTLNTQSQREDELSEPT